MTWGGQMRSGYGLTIINTNVEDEASKIYIRNKVKLLEENGVKTNVVGIVRPYVCDIMEAIQLACREGDYVILQLPLAEHFKQYTQELLDMIPEWADIDRLSRSVAYPNNKRDLPITAEVIVDLLEEFNVDKSKKILLIGYGMTTNKRLFDYLFKNYDNVFVIRSTTDEVMRQYLIESSDVIISSTGKAESLKVEGKIVISPTIHKSEDGKWVHDLHRDYMDRNITHPAIGFLGKRTCNKLLNRVGNL